jgi:hypothetical protein
MELSTGVINLTTPVVSSIESNLSSLGAQLFLRCLKQRVLSFEKQNPAGLSAHFLRIRLSESRLLLIPLRISFLSATSVNAMSLLVPHLGVWAVAVLTTKLRTVNLTNPYKSSEAYTKLIAQFPTMKYRSN